jgi:transcription antitermination factor NusG
MLNQLIPDHALPDESYYLSHAPAFDPCTSWFAVRVHSRSESVVASLLKSKSYECFAPTYFARRQYSDRMKLVEAALFSGYVFCRFNPAELLPILTTPGVQKVVTFGAIPEPVSDLCIQNLRLALLHGAGIAPAVYPRVGQRVRVTCGALAGVEGVLSGYKNAQRLTISADILCRAISIEIDLDQVVPA